MNKVDKVTSMIHSAAMHRLLNENYRGQGIYITECKKLAEEIIKELEK